jgi:NADH dehydrogenase
LIDALEGCDAVVHLAVAKADEPFSYDVNVVGAKNIIAACFHCGVSRVVNMSTQSAKIPRKGLYGATKAMADQAFEASGLAVTTLRASVVYGPDLLGVFGQLVEAVRKLPVVPVIGNGKWRSRPVHVRDLCTAVEAVLECHAAVGQTYDLGGPDDVTFDQLIDAVSDLVGRSRPKLHVPYWLVLPMVRVLARMVARPPVTVSNVLGSNQNVEFDPLPLARDVGFAPMPLHDGLYEVLADV